MTDTLDALPGAEALLNLTEAEYDSLAAKAHLGYWTQTRAKLDMSALHWEWCTLRMTERRLAVVAPREHSKSETFTVNGTVWESIYNPGLWTYLFAETKDQAEKMLARIVEVMSMVEPDMVNNARSENKSRVVFENWAQVTVAGAGKSVRGAHPDRIVGDDVLEESSTQTNLQRKRIEKWWLGTISGMTHPGTMRVLGRGETAKRVRMGATKVFLVGTPFHQKDLLMNMKANPVYKFRRYAAEFNPDDLVDGLAVEVG